METIVWPVNAWECGICAPVAARPCAGRSTNPIRIAIAIVDQPLGNDLVPNVVFRIRLRRGGLISGCSVRRNESTYYVDCCPQLFCGGCSFVAIRMVLAKQFDPADVANFVKDHPPEKIASEPGHRTAVVGADQEVLEVPDPSVRSGIEYEMHSPALSASVPENSVSAPDGCREGSQRFEEPAGLSS
ncbi:hypothetical protein LJ655_10985 [Paraburkholderia sp. MMS20-SJTN17]|uniref:Uncharacterized protein n=1 Tax=Paraburkholderia translucens TaxID=2886945 RepID=A0ABS8KCB2_9BURK|nr:hypothetical protein [Paraburkholderia sp. MMS20-SJTN17]MCC8402411.1 hypothetical protein [Paraburkholderia sp. MMS20-SJTN17]